MKYAVAITFSSQCDNDGGGIINLDCVNGDNPPDGHCINVALQQKTALDPSGNFRTRPFLRLNS